MFSKKTKNTLSFTETFFKILKIASNQLFRTKINNDLIMKNSIKPLKK